MKILHNARVYTLDPKMPVASVVVIDYGQIIAVGGEELLVAFAAGHNYDLGGRVVLPGLTDAHLHLQHYALALQKIDCETDTIEECLHKVSEQVGKSGPVEWILGHGWNHNVWGRWPSASDLDRISPSNPVYLTAKSLHASWVNSAALKLANISSGTTNPKDGQIQRGDNGQPTGILLENASTIVADHVPTPSVEELAIAIEKAQPILWQMGLTGVHDFDGRDCFMALQQLE